MKTFLVYLNGGSHQVIQADSYTFGTDLVILSVTDDDGNGYEAATYNRGDVMGVVDQDYSETPSVTV